MPSRMTVFGSALALAASVAIPLSAAAQAPSFTDIEPTDTYYSAVTSLAAQGIVRGYPDGSFRPRGQITRAEMLALLYRAVDTAEVARRAAQAPRSFRDVDAAAWYAPYVYAALHDGVVQGYPDGTFHPTLPVDAASALKMIVEARGIPKLEDVPGDRWYVAYANTLTQLNALPPWLLSPTEPMTRGTTAVVLYRVEQTRPEWQMIAQANPGPASSAGHAAAPPPPRSSSVPSLFAPVASRSSSRPAVTAVASRSASSIGWSNGYPGQEPDEITALNALKAVFDQMSQKLRAPDSN